MDSNVVDDIFIIKHDVIMNQDELRKKIIKDRFDELEPIVINKGQHVGLVNDKTYGLYYDYQYSGFGINPYYFMLNYIGLGFDTDNEVLREYTDYIANLAYDKFKLVVPSLFDNADPMKIIDYNTTVVDNINEFLFDSWERENR